MVIAPHDYVQGTLLDGRSNNHLFDPVRIRQAVRLKESNNHNPSDNAIDRTNPRYFMLLIDFLMPGYIF